MNLFAAPTAPSVSGTGNPPFHITLLGSFNATVGNTTLRKLRTRQGNRLLALLALRNGRAVDRTWLATFLWPDSKSDADALALLRRTLTDVRSALGTDAARITSPTKATLKLNLDGVFFDVREFDQAVVLDTRSALDRAIALYQGPLMPELDTESDWDGFVQNERQQRHYQFLSALEKRAVLLQRAGDYGAAMADVRRLLTIDPLRESALLFLMQWLAETGGRSEAIAEYQRFKERLSEGLGDHIQPESSLRALYERIKKLDDTDTFAEVDAPLATLPLVVGLPVPRTRFFGRTADLLRLENWISGQEGVQQRLVTITGPPGIGKTRLAIEATRKAIRQETIQQGWFVPLAETHDLEQAKAALGRALGLKSNKAADTEAIVGALRGSERSDVYPKRDLLVLDNAEHLLGLSNYDTSFATPSKTDKVDTSDEHNLVLFVHELLTRCLNLTCLIASRNSLLLSGEQELPLSPLSLPDTTSADSTKLLPQRENTSEAVALFEDRVKLIRPDFAPRSEERFAIASLCHKLDGVPLALEMAAARMRDGDIGQILEQVSARLETLTVTQRDLPSRQRSVAAVVAWSYDLLSLPARALLGDLAVFENGWTKAAALEVCEVREDNDLPNLLQELVRSSLVVHLPATEAVGERYRFLEIVRAYAGEKMHQSGRVSMLRKKHAQHFLKIALSYSRLSGSAYYETSVELEPERGNFGQAFASLLDLPENNQDALRLANALAGFYANCGPQREGRAMLSAALHAACPPKTNATEDDIRLWASALRNAGRMALNVRDMDASADLYKQATEWSTLIEDHALVSSDFVQRTYIAFETERFDEASEFGTLALEQARLSGVAVRIGSALTMNANVAMRRYDFPLARRLHEQAVDLMRTTGEVNGLASVLGDLGLVCCDLYDWEAARVALAESVSLCQAHGLNKVFLITLEGCAFRADGMGDVVVSARLYAAMRRLRDELGIIAPTGVEQHYLENEIRHQQTLGEAVYKSVFAEGIALSWDEAKDAAMASVTDSVSSYVSP